MGIPADLGVSVSRCSGDDSREQISKQAQEEGHILRDELRKVHVPQRLHEQKIFVFVQIVALCLARRPVCPLVFFFRFHVVLRRGV